MIDPFHSRIICFQLVKEAGVDLLLHSELSAVNLEGNRIRSVVVSGKGQHIEVEAKLFIDATGDGDLASMGGAECEKGDSENHVMQPPTLMFNLGGVDIDRFCDFIEEHPEELPYDVLPNIEEEYSGEFLRNNKSFIFLGMHHLLEEL